MALDQEIINTGTAPNAGDGDPLRAAFTKTNNNFSQLYSLPNTTPPTTLIGAPGDIAGMYAYDDTYFYYCYAPYNGNTTVWGQLVQSDEAIPSIGNGLSNVVIAFANANITVGVAGTSNVGVFSPTGFAVKGNLNANTSNIGIISANVITSNVSIASQSVTGGNITIATDSITSIGSTITIQPVSNVSVIGNMSVQGNITGGGNIDADGSRLILSASSLNNTAANLSGIQVGSGNGGYGELIYFSSANAWYSSIGISSASFISGITGAFDNVNVGNVYSGNVEVTTALVAGTLHGNGRGLYSISGGNIVGNVPNADFSTLANLAFYANIVTNQSQPNITSVGVLTNLAVSGNINSNVVNTGNVLATNIIVSNFTSLNNVNSPQIGNSAATNLEGTLGVLSNSQPNITQLGNVANFTVGNISGAGTWYLTGTLYADNVVGNITMGPAVSARQAIDFYQTSIGQVSSLIVNNELSASLIFATQIGNGGPNTILRGTLSTSANAQPNVTSVGNLVSLNIDGATNFGTSAANTTNINGNTISAGGATTTLNLGYNVNIPGNLQVQGTTVTVNSNTITINDLFINVANNASSSALANGGGIGVGPVGSEYASLYYVAVTDSWNMDAPLYVAGNINSTANINTVGITASGNITTSASITATGNIYAPSFNWANGSPVISTTGALSVSNINSTGNIASSANINAAGATFTGNVAGTNISVSGNVDATYFNGIATSAEYADLAENYLADAQYVPGTVVSFGGPKEITVSIDNMDVLVAGVISTNPAYTMNSGLTGNFVTPVALMGRVPCRVTGPVSRGAMMVSAGDGTARAEKNPAMGSVIGKSLESFDGNHGVIEIVVGKL